MTRAHYHEYCQYNLYSIEVAIPRYIAWAFPVQVQSLPIVIMGGNGQFIVPS
jgi:hypothetical protein